MLSACKCRVRSSIRRCEPRAGGARGAPDVAPLKIPVFDTQPVGEFGVAGGDMLGKCPQAQPGGAETGKGAGQEGAGRCQQRRRAKKIRWGRAARGSVASCVLSLGEL